MNLKVKVQRARYIDESIHWLNCEVSIDERAMLLELLELLQRKFAPDLAFDRNCRIGMCTSCRVKANGKVVLACQSKINHLIDDQNHLIIIEPAQLNFVVNDLICDPEVIKRIEKEKK